MRYISVIIPTYNRAEYIVPSIQSVLNQELPQGWGLEVLVVDDGSTDNTSSVLKKFGDTIIYKKIKHSGKPAVARNVGVSLAKGELIAFQDSDDLWPKDKLKKQLSYFKDESTILTYGRAEIMDSDGTLSGQQVVHNKDLKNGQSFAKLIKSNAISTLTVVIRKSAIEKAGGFNESDELRAIEDYDLWLRIIADAKGGFVCINEILAYYRRHKNNISSMSQLQSLQKIRNVFLNVWESILSNKDRAALEHQITLTEESITSVKSESGNLKPKVSIVMSVFNGERFLQDAVKSILDQSLRNFEFIIIDDGSTDTSREIIKKFNDDRIRLVPQQNKGLVFSLNKAIGLASSEFIARMDADDISHKTRLAKEYEWLSSDPKHGLVSSFFELIQFLDSKPLGTKIAYSPLHKDLRRCLYYVNPFAHGSAMYRKTAALEAGLYANEYWPAEDYDLWRKITKNYQTTLIPEVLFKYRVQNSKSISQGNNKQQTDRVADIQEEIWSETFIRKNVFEIFIDFKKLKKQIENDELTNLVKNNYLDQQFTLAKFLFLKGKLLLGMEVALGLLTINHRMFLLVLRYIPVGTKNLIKRLK